MTYGYNQIRTKLLTQKWRLELKKKKKKKHKY